MKKILMALTLAGLTYGSAEAQDTKPACEAPKGQVCRIGSKGLNCYKTKFAEDYKVCKGDYGYFICCETPNQTNSTFPKLNLVNTRTNYPRNPMETKEDETYTDDTYVDMTIPQSQSYVVTTSKSYTGYYNKSGKHYIKYCYGGDNVAELNRAPYNGCPTPAYDGPEANRARNLNSNNTIDDIPPITGQIR